MGEGFVFSRRHREGLIAGISAGFFFIVAGALFVIMPTLFDRIVTFLNSFDIVTIPNLGIPWPAPAQPFLSSHLTVYLAAERFSFIWGVFEIVLLVLRIVLRSNIEKIAETASNMLYWFGSGVLIRMFLLESVRFPTVAGLTRWFAFWAAIIMLFGVSLIIRGIIRAAVPMRYVAQQSMQTS
jgi:hypothetical protein